MIVDIVLVISFILMILIFTRVNKQLERYNESYNCATRVYNPCMDMCLMGENTIESCNEKCWIEFNECRAQDVEIKIIEHGQLDYDEDKKKKERDRRNRQDVQRRQSEGN
jgi:hypothetical protein